MTEEQTPVLVAELVRNQNHFRQLSNAAAQWVINNPVAAIALFIEAVKAQFGKFWREVVFGGKSKKTLIGMVQAARMRISDCAYHVISKDAFTTSAKVIKLPIVRVALRDWFDHDPTTDEIFAEAKKRGYGKLPVELTLALRLDYKDQPDKEWLVVAHEPIIDSGGNPILLCLQSDGDDLWVSVDSAVSSRCWNLSDEFLFLAPHACVGGQAQS